MSLFSDQARINWIKTELQRLPAGESILDAGAGELRYKRYCEHLKYKSQDFGGYDPRKDKTGIQPKSWNTSKVDIISDIRNIPVKSGLFDNVLCSEVLEHTPEPEEVIRELSRVMKKGGKLILTAPFCAQTHFAPYFYCTGFSTYWYKEVFAKYGFKIIKQTSNGNFFDYMGQELLRLPLVAKRYSPLGAAALILYIPIVPFVLLTVVVSKSSKYSENQLCFGWHIVARKIK